MRVKLLGLPPLTNVRAWCPIDSLQPSDTILDLKNHICDSIKPLLHLGAQDVVLHLDDFELRDETVLSVVRDGDLICVSQTQRKISSRAPPRKRQKLSAVANAEQIQMLVPVNSSSGGESSSGSTSDDSSSTSSSDSSSSEPEETSTTSSSSSSAHRSVPQLGHSAMVGQRKAPLTLVPPGHGTAATRSRNLRKRRMKHFQHEDRLGQPSVSSANLLAIGTKHSISALDRRVPPVEAVESTIPMSSLRNRNKNRGFKASMNNPLPLKIVFPTPCGTVESETVSALLFPTESDSAHSPRVASSHLAQYNNHALRLLAPSERDKNLIPSNILLTSIDVEEYAPVANYLRPTDPLLQEVSEQIDHECSRNSAGDGNALIAPEFRELDFGQCDRDWDTFSIVTEASQLQVGTLVGWKALGINSSTLSPEVLVHLARVSGLKDNIVSIHQIRRPVSRFEFAEDDLEDETYVWVDILAKEWRIVIVT